jgi:hypothetical protein
MFYVIKLKSSHEQMEMGAFLFWFECAHFLGVLTDSEEAKS